MSHADEKTITIKQAIADGVVKLKYWWRNGRHIPEIGSDCCGNELEYDPYVKSMPTTGTFHHLGHEGKVFAHSDRHAALANAGVLDYLIIIPAGNPLRQVHMRYGIIGKANTGTLDVDIELFKDSITSANGTPESIVSTNDANVRTTDVTLFVGPTVSNVGTFKTATALIGEKKSASNLDQAVPEWILAPNGILERKYIVRITNNSGGTVDVINGIFFYDTHSEPV